MTKGLSDAEYGIMQIVWRTAPAPTLFAPLQQALAEAGHPCHKNTLITLLGRLLNKGYLRAVKSGRRNEYHAVVSENDFQQSEAKGFVDRYYAGSAAGLMTTLVQADMLTPDEYRELKAVLQRYEK